MTSHTRTVQPNAQIRDEAAYWFVEVSEGELDVAGRQEFDRWLRASPEHVRAYLQVSALWEDAPLVAKDRDLDVDDLLRLSAGKDNVLQLHPDRPSHAGTVERTGWGARWPWPGTKVAIASAAGLVVGIVILLAVVRPWARVYVTDIGEQQAITLRDGSIIELNSRSRARVTYTKTERGVDLLEGQALFHVAKDPSRPFVVRCGLTRVRAVGTQFDVYRKASGITVTVVEGRVLVFNAGSPKATRASANEAHQPTSSGAVARVPEGDAEVLNAGQQVTVARNLPLQPSVADVESTTAWIHRRLVFKSSPLTEVVAEYNRYNLRRLVIGDPALRDFHVSGVFAAADDVSLVEFLRAQPNLTLRMTDSQIEITTKDR